MRAIKASFLFVFLAFSTVGLLTSCDAIGAQVLNNAVPREGYRVGEGIAYGEGERGKLDVYQPESCKGECPVVMYFYGGAWQGGDRGTYRFIGQALAAMGYVAVLPDYRLYPEIRYPDFLTDGAKAVAWVQKHAGEYGGNAGKIVLMGHSAGAYNAVMLALDTRYLAAEGVQPQAVKGVIGLAGPYDFLPFDDKLIPNITAIFSPEKEAMLTQPLHYARKNAPPMLLLTGAADTLVKPRNSQALKDALVKLGDRAEYKEYPGMDHIDIVTQFAMPLHAESEVREDVRGFVGGVVARQK